MPSHRRRLRPGDGGQAGAEKPAENPRRNALHGFRLNLCTLPLAFQVLPAQSVFLVRILRERLLRMAEELCHTSLGITYAQALGYSLAALLGCGLWLWAWGRCLQPGPWRLAAAAPVVALNFALPKLFCRWEDSTTIVLMR